MRGVTTLAFGVVVSACGAAPQEDLVAQQQKINELEGGFKATLTDHAVFGRAVVKVGDLDKDGVAELAVGAFGESDGGPDRGAVYILFMNRQGVVRKYQKISSTAGSFTTLRDGDKFGTSLATLGDLDGDGVDDLLVGAVGYHEGRKERGALWVLFLATDGTVKSYQRIGSQAGGFVGVLPEGSTFGISAAALGDVNGDGVTDVVIGARRDDDGGPYRGAAWILFLKRDGTVLAQQKISSTAGQLTATLADSVEFGQSVGSLGDFDGDGVPDMVVGAFRDRDGGTHTGAVWLIFLERDGTVKGHRKISPTEGGFTGRLRDKDLFGSGVAAIGDLNGDQIPDLAVGARRTDDGGLDRGAIWILQLNRDGTVQHNWKISQTRGGFQGRLMDDDQFGYSLGAIGDLNGDNMPDLATGAIFDDGPGQNRGAVWILFLKNAPSIN